MKLSTSQQSYSEESSKANASKRLTPYLNDDHLSLNPIAASRFLAKSSTGVTEQSLNRVLEIGYSAWIDEQMSMPIGTTRVEWLSQYTYKEQSSPRRGLPSLWRHAIVKKTTLRQRTVLALSEIFVVNQFNLKGKHKAFAGPAYMDMLEQHAFGDYRTLLDAVTHSLQMGQYLSMLNSAKANKKGSAPDENYAREILQLFSIGLHELNQDGTVKRNSRGQPIETYSTEDIEGLAAAFTGWVEPPPVNTNKQRWTTPLTNKSNRHDKSSQQFLGINIPKNTDGRQAMLTALDAITAHANVAPFIGRQLIQRLVTSNPSSHYVQRVSSAFNNDGTGKRGNLAAVVRAILLDPEAHGNSSVAKSERGKLREPMLRLIQWSRLFAANEPESTFDDIGVLNSPSKQLAQTPLSAPSVFNFYLPGYTPPNTELAQRKLNAPELQIVDETSVVGYANFMQKIITGNNRRGLKPDYSAWLDWAKNVDTLIDKADLLLANGNFSSKTRVTIKQALESMPDKTPRHRTNRVKAVVLLTMLSTDYLVMSA